MKAWARLRDGRAKRSFDEMATRCCVPTDATCLQILAACVPAGNLDVARHVLTYLRRTRKAPVQAFETACAAASEAQAWPAQPPWNHCRTARAKAGGTLWVTKTALRSKMWHESVETSNYEIYSSAVRL